MKNLMVILFTLGGVLSTFAQEQLFETKIPEQKVPATITNALNQDFPGLVYKDFKAIPLKYFENSAEINNNQEGADVDFDTYQVLVYGKDKKIIATYDKSGTLISTEEVAKKEALPFSISEAVAKSYPGWRIFSDAYKMAHYSGHREIDKYKIILEKGSKRMKIYLDANGKLLKNLIRDHNRGMYKKDKMS